MCLLSTSICPLHGIFTSRYVGKNPKPKACITKSCTRTTHAHIKKIVSNWTYFCLMTASSISPRKYFEWSFKYCFTTFFACLLILLSLFHWILPTRSQLLMSQNCHHICFSRFIPFQLAYWLYCLVWFIRCPVKYVWFW